MDFRTCTTAEKVKGVTLQKTTSQGAPLDATPAPVWTAENGPSDPGTVVPSADGLSADLISGTVPGDTVYLVEAFSGGQPISAEITLTVTPVAGLGELVFTGGDVVPKAQTVK